MQQQFGPQFINEHLMPLLEEMLTDTVLRKKDYLDKLFINGQLEAGEKKNLMDYYFDPARANIGVPFTGPEEQQDRENFLKNFVEYVRSRGATPQDRIRAFLPVVSQEKGAEGQIIWPMDVKRNLFLISYNIAEDFEKTQLKELIKAKESEGKTDEAKQDTDLLEKGLLTLVKDPATGEFINYVRAPELKPGQSAVEFLPAPNDETAQIMRGGFAIPSAQNLQTIAKGGTSPQTVAKPAQYSNKPVNQVPDKQSTNEDLTKNFEKKRGKAMVNHLKKLGMQVIGDVMFDPNGHATVKVKSGNDTLLVSVNSHIPLNADPNKESEQNLKFDFTFQDGPNVGKHFTIDESKLDESFKNADNSMKTARQLFDDIQKIKEEDHPEKMPNKPQPLIRVEAPQQEPDEAKGRQFVVPGNLSGQSPVARGLYLPAQGNQLNLPNDINAPQQPKGKQNGEGDIMIAPTRPISMIPRGTIMDAKAKFKQQKADQDNGPQKIAQNPEGLPVAPGRFNGDLQPIDANVPAQKKPKDNTFKIIAIANGVGLGSAFGTTALLSGTQDTQNAAATAFNVAHNVLIAFIHHLPRLFG